MTAEIHLVRHGHHPLLGRVLCGRMEGVQMDEQGCREMAAAADAIRQLGPIVLQSSPQRRTMQSARIIAHACDCAIEIVPAFDELDFGDWTGASFETLEHDPRWPLWNSQRDVARPPNGESMVEVQVRVVRHIEQLRHEERTIVIVSHAEPIRAALMHYLDVPLQLFHTIDIAPASISTIMAGPSGAIVSRLNGEVTA